MRIYKTKQKSIYTKLCTWRLKDHNKVCKFLDKFNNLLDSDVDLILESIEDKGKHQNVNLLWAT